MLETKRKAWKTQRQQQNQEKDRDKMFLWQCTEEIKEVLGGKGEKKGYKFLKWLDPFLVEAVWLSSHSVSGRPIVFFKRLTNTTSPGLSALTF